MFLVPFHKKGLENRSSRFEPKNSWLSFSRGSGPPLRKSTSIQKRRNTSRVRTLLDAYNRSNHVGGLAVAGSLTSHTMWSGSGRSSTQVMPIARASMSVLPGAQARRAASLACAPVTPLCCGLLFCVLYDVLCSVGLLHKIYAAAPTQHISFATAAQPAAGLASSPCLEHVFFSISIRAPDPTPRPSGPFFPFLPRELTPNQRNRILALTPNPRALGWEVQRAVRESSMSISQQSWDRIPQSQSNK